MGWSTWGMYLTVKGYFDRFMRAGSAKTAPIFGHHTSLFDKMLVYSIAWPLFGHGCPLNPAGLPSSRRLSGRLNPIHRRAAHRNAGMQQHDRGHGD